MGFDYRKFERNVSVTSLARLGCSPEVLKHAACRYGIALMLPGERRKALVGSGLTHKQLSAKAAEARELAGFLRRLAGDPKMVAGNNPPRTPVPVWCRDLEDMARWIESQKPFRPDAKEAACALAIHVEARTGSKRLKEISELLNASLNAAGISPNLTADTLERQIYRADRKRAKEMLGNWETL